MIRAELALRAACRDRRSRRAAVLTASFVAIATALVVLLASLPRAVEVRFERSAWQYGSAEQHGSAGQHGVLGFLALSGSASLIALSLVLVDSIARWTAARRQHRLAALRLSGATPRQEVGAAIVEAAVPAASGALGGVLLSWALRFLAMRAPRGGGTWFASDVVPSPVVIAVAGIGVPLLAVSAACGGLRSEIAGWPAGGGGQTSRRRPAPRRHRAIAVVSAFAVVMALSGFGFGFVRRGEHLAALALVSGAVLAAAWIVGPRLMTAVGGAFPKLRRNLAILLAGR